MVPFDTGRLYRIESTKSRAEVRLADQQAGELASWLSSLFRGLTRPARTVWRPALDRRAQLASPGLTSCVCDASRS